MSSSARGFVGIAAEQAGAFEVREVGVHCRGRGEAHGVADLAHGRRVPVRVHVLDEELPDLLLACGEHRGLEHQGLQSPG